MNTTKETFHHVTAEMLSDQFGNAVMLTQVECADESTIVLHPIQLRHIAERFAGMEPNGWMTTQPVRTLSRRLRTLAFHIDYLYDYIKNHSDHTHADLSFELSKAIALTEMASEFCADLPNEDDEDDADEPYVIPSEAPATSASKGLKKPEQAELI